LPRLRFLDAQPPGRLRPDERRALIAELAEM
jgi:hypothetical protein